MKLKDILKREVIEELILLGIEVGMHYPDWKYAQDICIKLVNHENPIVRANAVLGLAHTARTKGRLEKHLVKPVVLRELRNNSEYRGTILVAIEDINQFLNWTLGLKLMKKYFE